MFLFVCRRIAYVVGVHLVVQGMLCRWAMLSGADRGWLPAGAVFVSLCFVAKMEPDTFAGMYLEIQGRCLHELPHSYRNILTLVQGLLPPEKQKNSIKKTLVSCKCVSECQLTLTSEESFWLDLDLICQHMNQLHCLFLREWISPRSAASSRRKRKQ